MDPYISETQNTSNFMLVTANVGSLFENPIKLLKPWINEFLVKTLQLKPQFIALHMQEVGGKTYDKSMEHVQQFITELCESLDINEYPCIHIYMDEDYNSAEHFTALGNLYFTHKTVRTAKIWNFLTYSWEMALGKNIYTGNIEGIATKDKSKFPQHFFPECKWSRKGFMRTRWEINGTVMDLVNIHLFHDASNLVACEEFPSVYCKTRRRALVHILERFHLDYKNGLVPFFIFGDFNFRCDTEGVIKEITENLTGHRVCSNKHESTKLLYCNAQGDNVLTVGKKEFLHADHQSKFKESWLKKFDRELEAFSEILVEFPIGFPPTYPYEENPEMPSDYMSTRCPSWCDRILMSMLAKDIIEESKVQDDDRKQEYNVIGENCCMGDHKPIYLHIKVKTNQGIYKCCKCYLNYDPNTNKSTSHIRSVPVDNIISNSIVYCPYNIRGYNRVLIECNNINNNLLLGLKKKYDFGKISQMTSSNDVNLPKTSHISTETLRELKPPQVSINLFDSDNINVCMCSSMINYTIDNINESICSECHNVIRKNPINEGCTLISKRLVLSSDIIVNRIDTQHLNTYCDFTHQDPYTPESAESHSPNPEYISSTSASSNSHNRFSQQVENKDVNPTVNANSSDYKLLNYDGDNSGVLRGIVTPCQLISRLEDLQRSSQHSLHNSNCEDTGDSDVDNVDKANQYDFKRSKCSCLLGCCRIS